MIEERWYLNEAIYAVFSYFEKESGNPVIAWPTGTGKSLLPAKFMHQVMHIWPNQRFMVLTHVKELVEQNAKALLRVWPTAPLGVYSASLKSRDTMHPIIFGGVASVKNCVAAFGWRDILFIDECHLLSPDEDTMYQQVITELKATNPFLKVIGLSATPFRMGQGLITDGGLFTHIIHDLTNYEMYNRLIAEGYLSPLIPRPMQTQLDISKVPIQNGELKQVALQQAVNQDGVTRAALIESVNFGKDRRAWLAFCSGIEHAENVAACLIEWNIPAAAVHSKMTTEERNYKIDAFKRGELRCLTNNNILTTGFDHPPIDLIIMLRPTLSPGLWVQMAGRGTRPSRDTGKGNCLLLDFARNTQRLGPINDPRIPRKKGDKEGDVPVKLCDACGAYNHARATHCTCCGAEFTFAVKITKKASTDQLLKSDLPVVEYFNVQHVTYQRFETKGSKIPALRATYFVNEGAADLSSKPRTFTENVLFEHIGFARHRANEWWRQRHNSEPPITVQDALKYISQLRMPKKVRVWTNKEWPEILGYEY